jgi:hypothetical protein
MAASLRVGELLGGHVALDVECLDRVYLNGYVPNLQVGGQVASFMTARLGCPIYSPAIMEKMGTAFRRAVRGFADTNHIRVVRFHKGGERKIDVMGRYLAAQAAAGRCGVAAIGVAQEYQNVFAATRRERSNGYPWFSFAKADRRVSCFSFYRWDVDFGPALIKICAYFPYLIKENGLTAMSGPSVRRPRLGSSGPRCPTASPPARTPPRSRGSATGSDPGPSRSSSGGGWPPCRCH